MVRVDIETIVMAAGPVPSLIVLRERCSKSDSPAPLRSLSIQTGSFEAAAISRGIDSGRAERPIAHEQKQKREETSANREGGNRKAENRTNVCITKPAISMQTCRSRMRDAP